MAEKVRLNLQVSEQLNSDLEEMADSTGSNRTEVIRQALALMKIAHQARREGRHLGLVSDPSKLDTELVGIL
jgi:metal-responsive CopG/Arc/MetJ family transcriptional regulator